MKKNISTFIYSLDLPEQIAKDILLTYDDCECFYINFYGRNTYFTDDLLDFREYKIAKSKVTLDKFIDMCNNGNVASAFKETFLQSFSLLDLLAIDKAVSNGKTSFEKIFIDFMKNPNKNVIRNIL